MSILLIIDAKLTQESVSKAVAFYAEIVSDTRSFEGCEAIEICIDSEDAGNLVVVEKWASEDLYKKHYQWREETGVLDHIRALLDGPVSRQVLNVAA